MIKGTSALTTGPSCSLYHCAQTLSKRSLMVSKCVDLLDMLGKLYKYQHLYSRLIVVNHKEYLLINCSDSDSDALGQVPSIR